jgi:two-component system chemotaxis response regulator CheB
VVAELERRPHREIVSPTHHHDILVVGASAGGVTAVTELLGRLPRDLAAAVFVVVHLDPAADSHLAEIINREQGLQATQARHGDVIQAGHVWIAPPDHHLMVRPGKVEVVRGPRENRHRPSVDVLFRTAAAAYDSRVIGVVLTGYQDCGTAGLLSIKARGGLAVVQDPTEAVAPNMPRSAIAHVAVDHVVRLRDMPDLLEGLVRRPAGPRPGRVQKEVTQMEGKDLGSKEAELVCPSCQGQLTIADVDGYLTFRCHVGHAFSLQALSSEQAEEVERALWASVRALEEAARLSNRLAQTTSGTMRARFDEQEEAQRAHADVVRGIVLGGQVLNREDARGITETASANTNASERAALASGWRSLQSGGEDPQVAAAHQVNARGAQSNGRPTAKVAKRQKRTAKNGSRQ